MDITERETARLAGLKVYFTGKLCKNGHVSHRYVQSGTCAECINGSRNTDLRRVGLPEDVVRAELKARETGQAEAINRATLLKEEHEQRVAAAAKAQAEAEALERARELARRDMRVLHAHIVEEDLRAIREFAVFMAQSVAPVLQYDDVIRADHYKNGEHYLFWLPLECKALVDAEWQRAYKVRRPIVQPWDGVMTVERLRGYYPQWYEINGDLYFTEPPTVEVRKYDGEEMVRLGGRWYRDWELTRMMRGTLSGAAPVSESWAPEG
jgi:hypothetical protein